MKQERRLLDLDDIRAHGWLGERIDRAYAAVSNLYGSLWWHGSHWGYEHAARWLRNVVMYGRYCGEFHPAMREVAGECVTLVEDGTALRDYAKYAVAAYNEEELLMGLVEYYRHFPEPRVLAAAKRVGRSLVENHPKTPGRHFYKGLAIGRLFDLAEVSGEELFRRGAVEIAEEQELSVLRQEGGSHGAVGPMIAIWHLQLYRATGESRYLDWALEIWRATKDRMFITGGLGEVLFFTKPPSESDLHDETCQHAWWMLFNCEMWRATGENRYLDCAERILYNHLLFGQLHRGEDGGFCALGDIDQGYRGLHNYICCDNEGFYSLLQLLRYAVTCEPERISLNLLLPVDVNARVRQQSVRMKVATPYPVRGYVTVALEMQDPCRFALRVRVPGGGAPAGVRVNGAEAAGVFRDGYLAIDRIWQDGDTLVLLFPMQQHIETDMTGDGAESTTVVVDGRECRAKRIGVLHGPVLAALFRCGHNNDLSWVWNGDYPEPLDSGGSVYEGYPMSRSDYFDMDGRTLDTRGPASDTAVLTLNRIPSICWSRQLGKVRLTNEVTIYPGLPVTMDWRETIDGGDSSGRLLCSGIRYATVKQTKDPRYGASAFPYPFPAVTTWDNLTADQEYVAGGGSFSFAERIADGGELRKSGTFRLSNGSFRVICHYDRASVEKVLGRVAAAWAGVYLVPMAGGRAVLQRRLIFPLYENPLGQDLTRVERERAATAHSRVETECGVTTLVLESRTIQDAPILIPRSLGLKAGTVVFSGTVAVALCDFDESHLVARLPSPGKYAVKAT